MTKAPVIAICHGGGALPMLNDPAHKNLIASLKTKVPELLGIDDHGKNEKGLRAIVVVTAHVCDLLIFRFHRQTFIASSSSQIY